MRARDGGPAFPLQATERDSGYAREPEHGMSLRDWFAGQALVALFSEAGHPQHEGWNAAWAPEAPARIAYQLADAMLAAREEG